jgi:hypothetical protein
MHRHRTTGLAIYSFFMLATGVLAIAQDHPPKSPAELIDAYLDQRFDGDHAATKKLLAELKQQDIEKMEDLEKSLRDRRATYPDNKDLIGKTTKHEVECLHVDYKSSFLMFVPAEIDLEKPISLVVVGHGGNSSMSPERAESTAQTYLRLYAPAMSKNMNAIFVAPVSGRGWGHIGNSLILSTISKVQRMFPVDPDRMYITGQSMGGHMTYRAALSLADRWGAVSPHSGGYDYVEKQQIANLLNVPGYAIWGIREPYGINTDNRTNQKWATDQHMDWKFVEKNGGHTIYVDELPNVAEFFNDHSRDLYRKAVYMKQGGDMKFVKTWGVAGWPDHKVYFDEKPLRWNVHHWLEIKPRPDVESPLTIFAKNNGDNSFEITSENVRDASIYLHPKMVDFSKPVKIVANGVTVFEGNVEPNPPVMFELAREFDDRGRIYWSRIDFKIESDKQVPMEIVGK